MDTWQLFANTAFLAIGSAVLASLLAYAIAPWLQNRIRSRRLVSTLWTVPFVLPAFLMGLVLLPIQSLLNLNSNFGMYWILIAHVLMNAGYLAGVIVANAPPKSQVESAQLAGARASQLRRFIELPYIMPALVPAALLVALYSATSFGLIITLGQGISTLETGIVISALRNLDLPTGLQLALLQTMLTAVLFILARWAGKGRDVETEFESQAKLQSGLVGKLLGPLFTAVLCGVLLSVFSQSFSGPGVVENLVNLIGQGARDILNISVFAATMNSLRNALVSVTIATYVAWTVSNSRRIKFWPLIPIGISPVVIGLGTLILIGHLPRVVSSSWLVVPVMQAVLLVPLIYQLIQPARNALPQETMDAAQIDGASRWQLTRFILFPQLAPTLKIAIALASISAIGEFGAATFLAFGDQATVPVVLVRLIGRPGAENYGMAMAAASIFILLSAYVIWLVNRQAQTQLRVF